MHYLVIGHCEFKEPDYLFYQGNYNATEIEKMAEKDLTEQYVSDHYESGYDDADEDELPIVYIDHIFESESEIHFTKGFFQ